MILIEILIWKYDFHIITIHKVVFKKNDLIWIVEFKDIFLK